MSEAIPIRKPVLVKTASPTPKRRRMRAEERRQHLISVALRLFATHGFSGTTTKAIAEGAGISEAVIFRHFRAKDDLYAAILHEKARQDGYDDMMKAVQGYAQRDEDENMIHYFVLTTLENFQRDPNFQRMILFAALEKHEFGRLAKRMFGLPLAEFLRNYVQRRQKAGAFRKGDPRVLAFSIMALPLHFAMITQVFGVKRVKGSNRSLADAFTRILLTGLYSEKSPAQRV
jgi:AcrR family transcriptional regulator